MSSDDIICPSKIRNERARDSGRLEVTLLRKRKSSRLGRVSGLSRGLKEERGTSRGSLFTYVHHLPLSLSLPPSPFTTVFPPSLLPCSPPLFSPLSRSPPFVSVMFSNGSGVRHDTKRHDRECSLLPRVLALQGIEKWSFSPDPAPDLTAICPFHIFQLSKCHAG